MKKINVTVVAWLLLGSLTMSSCIGSFTLFNKFAKWETQMTSNKYVNAIVGFIITPFVGSVCLLGDALLFNTIEFWSGSNPIADIGKTRTIMGQDGRYYAVTTLKDGYEIKAPTGEVTNLKYNKKNNSWTMEQNGDVKEIFRFNDDGTIMATVNGEPRTYTLDESHPLHTDHLEQPTATGRGCSFWFQAHRA